jgi:hypothetical protein
LIAAVISVAAIMQQRMDSGKPRAGRDNHAITQLSPHFPQSGMMAPHRSRS